MCYRAVTLLNIFLQMSSGLYSLIVSTTPHVAATYTQDAYKELSPLLQARCIDLDKKVSNVSLFLNNKRNLPHYAGSAVGNSCPRATHKTDPLYRVTAIRDKKKYDIDTETNDIFICFIASLEIAKLFAREEISWINYETGVQFVWETFSIHQLTYLRGVYAFELDHQVESHGFTLAILEDTITVYNGYGGVTRFYVSNFDREEWCRDFVYFFTEASVAYQIKNYDKPWGLPKENTDPIIQGATIRNPLRLTRLIGAKIR